MPLHRRQFLGLLATAVVGRRLPPSPVFTGVDLATGPDATAIVAYAPRDLTTHASKAISIDVAADFSRFYRAVDQAQRDLGVIADSQAAQRFPVTTRGTGHIDERRLRS